MNIIDLVILVILAYALYGGARNGIIIQGLSIVGIGLGIWCGTHFGDSIAKFMGFEKQYAAMMGFLIAIILTLLVVAIVARVVRQVLQFAGFGLLDLILGAILSVCKYLLILSVLFSLFDTINHTFKLVDHKQIEKSTLYRPIANISTYITPAWDWTKDQLDA